MEERKYVMQRFVLWMVFILALGTVTLSGCVVRDGYFHHIPIGITGDNIFVIEGALHPKLKRINDVTHNSDSGRIRIVCSRSALRFLCALRTPLERNISKSFVSSQFRRRTVGFNLVRSAVEHDVQPISTDVLALFSNLELIGSMAQMSA